MRTRVVAVLAIAALPLSYAYAEPGLDAVNQQMIDNGLFRPHADTCVTGEAFLPLGAGGTAGTTGLCVEEDERSADHWEDARQTCAALGKRLPEPSEYKIACRLAGSLGLNDMTDDDEWASNFSLSTTGYDPGSNWYRIRIIPVAGSGSCLHMSFDNAAHNGSVEGTIPFRCVR